MPDQPDNLIPLADYARGRDVLGAPADPFAALAGLQLENDRPALPCQGHGPEREDCGQGLAAAGPLTGFDVFLLARYAPPPPPVPDLRLRLVDPPDIVA